MENNNNNERATVYSDRRAASAQRAKAKKQAARKKRMQLFWCVVRRSLLVFFTVVLIAFGALVLVLNAIFNGPSVNARNKLTMSMRESSGMKWCPGIFLGADTVAEIEKESNYELPDELSDLSQVKIDLDSDVVGADDAWADAKDGIRLESVQGDTFNAHVMLIRDPSRVYLATSVEKFSTAVPGTRITEQIETENAVAAINAGAFWDNGTSSKMVGSVPQDLVISGGKVMWESGSAPEEGFVGFNQDDILVVAQTMTGDRAMELGIRDGCCFGPVLISNGEVALAENNVGGLNPRTAIGQRSDGAILMLVIDGRQVSSIGATYRDLVDIFLEYGAVNACNLDGGSSTMMWFGDGYVNNSASVIGIRPVPTAFVVLKEGVTGNE